GIPLIAWQEYFVASRDKPHKPGWWRLAHEALVYDKPDEGSWRRLSGEERREVVLSLDDAQPEFVRQRVLTALGEARDSPELRVRLRKFAKDSNPAIRVAAARSLLQHEPAATDFVEDLLGLMEDERGFVTDDLCAVLGKIGAKAPEAVMPALLARIDLDRKISHAALIVLAR